MTDENEKIKKLAAIDFDFDGIDSIRYGMDIKKYHKLRDQLRKACAKVGLIHIAEKRWAGQDYEPEIHDDSNNIPDKAIEIILGEYELQLKEEWKRKQAIEAAKERKEKKLKSLKKQVKKLNKSGEVRVRFVD